VQAVDLRYNQRTVLGSATSTGTFARKTRRGCDRYRRRFFVSVMLRSPGGLGGGIGSGAVLAGRTFYVAHRTCG
jgi:hypothetical protein